MTDRNPVTLTARYSTVQYSTVYNVQEHVLGVEEDREKSVKPWSKGSTSDSAFCMCEAAS